MRRVFIGRRPTPEVSGWPATAACHAPFTSMFLDPRGQVKACCKSTQPLGSIVDARLPEIWHGAQAARLRTALAQADYSLGCGHCEWQADAGMDDAMFARNYDQYPIGGEGAWPKELSFSLSNACNLECTMCNGENSSTIRKNRDKLPPLPVVYDDQFFDDLRAFLPHLTAAVFAGGEPFLSKEALRTWDLMRELGVRPEAVSVTTNGTVWSHRVEAIIEDFRMGVQVSVDGYTAETLEAIRIGVDRDKLFHNIEHRFLPVARRQDSRLGISFCLMTDNWHEFGDLLLWADALGLPVNINVVDEPVGMSLYNLPPDRMAEVIAEVERQDRDLAPRLGLNAKVWSTELSRMRARSREHQADGDGSPLWEYSLNDMVGTRPTDHEHVAVPAVVDEVRDWAGGEPATAEVLDDVFQSVSTDPFALSGAEVPSLVGVSVAKSNELMLEIFGPPKPAQVRVRSAAKVDLVVPYVLGEHPMELRMVMLPHAKDDAADRVTMVLASRPAAASG